MALERLQKIIARAGIASRRAAERLVTEGRVSVNGKVVTRLGAQADAARDHIKVDGKLLKQDAGPRHYFVAFKPRNMITSLEDPEGRPTVADLLRSARIKARVFPVGRLDWDADGLLFLTDDGDLANQVAHPRSHLPKSYRVKVKGVPSGDTLDRVRRGVYLERGQRTLPCQVSVEGSGRETTWLRVTLVEGRQNQIKRVFQLVGHPVRRIRRTAIGPLRLGRLKIGEVRALGARELAGLRKALAADGTEAPATARRGGRRRERARKKSPGRQR